MNALLDIFIVIIFVVCIYSGYKNGFVKSVMGIVSFIVAFIMARMFTPSLSELIYAKYIKPTFVNRIIEDLADIIGKGIEYLDLNKLLAEVPKEFDRIITSYGSNVDEVQSLLDKAVSTGTQNVNNYVAANLVSPLAQNISNFIAFTAIFLIVLILCGIITAVINGIAKLPVLNTINRLGGTLLGILHGIVWSYVIVFLISLVLPYCAARHWINSVSALINNTTIFKWLYENMPFDLI